MTPNELLEKLRPHSPAFRAVTGLMWELSKMSEKDKACVIREGLLDSEVAPTISTQQLVLEFIENGGLKENKAQE